MKEAPIYQALTRSSTLLGLPYEYFVLLLVLCMAPLIWAQGVLGGTLSVVWLVIVYCVLRFFAARDELAVKSFLEGQRAVPGTMSSRVFGGDSFGP